MADRSDFQVHSFLRRFALFISVLSIFFLSVSIADAAIATTTLNISICGDAILNTGEVCDEGVLNNDGAYATSAATRRCNPSCGGYGPYCANSILEALYGEECDDGNNVSGDRCSATCIIEGTPASTGGGTGGPGSLGGSQSGTVPLANPTRVIIEGKGYPRSNVNILKDGEVIGVVAANGNADFRFEITNITPGATTFGFWAEDRTGLRSIAFTTTFNVTERAVTTVSGVFLPPTIEIDKRSVNRGETVTVSGHTVPVATVLTHFNSEEEVIETVESDGAGEWELEFDTTPLENEEFHTAKAMFEVETPGLAGEVKSGFSQALSFYVGDKEFEGGPNADLNRDGRVNLVDFSILLFWWDTDGGDSDPPADINQDDRVSLTDFSILLFQWTG